MSEECTTAAADTPADGMSAADVAQRLYSEMDGQVGALTLSEVERAATEAGCDPWGAAHELIRLSGPGSAA